LEKSAQERYRLHPLIKIFVHRKLKDVNLYCKLASYYERLFSQLGRGNSTNYTKVEEELENIRGVFDKCFAAGFYNKVIGIWQYLGLFLWDTGRWSGVERYGWIVVEACRKAKDKKSLASCYIDELSWLYFWQGDLKKSEYYANEGLKIAAKLGDSKLIALAYLRLGMVLQAKGQNEKARQIFKKALIVFKRLRIWYLVTNTFLYLGHTYMNEKNLYQAKIYYQQSLQYSKKTQEHEGFSIALYYLGDVFLSQKKYILAEKYYSRSLAIDRFRGRRPGFPWCLYGLGRVKKALGQYKEAYKLFSQSKVLYMQLGIKEQIKKVISDLKSCKIQNS
jgi:tetratricopeptide (TPR) repeat protein